MKLESSAVLIDFAVFVFTSVIIVYDISVAYILPIRTAIIPNRMLNEPLEVFRLVRSYQIANLVKCFQAAARFIATNARIVLEPVIVQDPCSMKEIMNQAINHNHGFPEVNPALIIWIRT